MERCPVCRMMSKAEAPLPAAWVAKPARRLCPPKPPVADPAQARGQVGQHLNQARGQQGRFAGLGRAEGAADALATTT